MGQFIDMTGWIMKEHGVPDSRLTVIRKVEDKITKSGTHLIQWLCKCDCDDNKFIKVTTSHLKSGHTLSCGCLKKESLDKLNKQKRKTNEYDLTKETYGIGYTSKNEEFWFDKEDYDKIKDYHWYYDNEGYVRASIYIDGKHKSIALHILVMSPVPENMVVDHIYHPSNAKDKKINNQKNNLRYVTRSQNSQNQIPIRKNNTSGHKGVSWCNGCWRARIVVDHKEHIQYFSPNNYQKACEWYDKMSEKLHGDYKYKNK